MCCVFFAEDTMKKGNYPVIFFLLVSALLFYLVLSPVSAMAGESQKAFQWADDEDYYPIIYKGNDGKPAGLYKEIMEELFQRMNIPLEGRVYPWKRAQKYVEEGRADGMITTLTRRRSVLFKATDPLFINKETVFARSDNPRIQEIMAARTLAALKPFTVVEAIGSGWAKEHFKGLNVHWAPSNTSALDMLARGRADIYILGRYPGLRNIKNRIKKNTGFSKGLEKIIASHHSLADVKFSLLIRKDSSYIGLLPLINKTLRQMKADGTYHAIFVKYFPDDDDFPKAIENKQK